MKRILHILALGAAAAGAALPAAAQFNRPEDAVHYRQGAWYVINHHFTRVGLMARGRLPYDAKLAVQDAEVVATLAKLTLAGFAPGTDTAGDKARPEIWTEHARFKEFHEKLQADTARLAAVAKTQDIEQLKAAYAATANTCKGCHDAYRSN
jgi:cytochrome c556